MSPNAGCRIGDTVITNAWPAMQVEWGDIVGRADDVRAVLQSWEYSDAGISAQEITRMEAAQDWLRVILAPYRKNAFA